MSDDRGSVRWHRNGWEIRVRHEGRRHTERVRAPNTRAGRRQAEAALDALIARLGVGDDGSTVARLIDRYETAFSAGWSPSTRYAFGSIRRPLVDAFGQVPVDKLRASDIEATYGRWMTEGLSVATVRRRHSVLAAAYRHAERWGLVLRSPAASVAITAQTVKRHDDLPTAPTVFDALEQLSHRRLQVAARLAVATGARRSELAGLRWSDVDLDGGTVAFTGAVVVSDGGELVRKGTKTGRPKSLALDEGTVADLRVWRTEAKRAALELGHHQVPGDPVLTAATDPTSPWRPDKMSQEWVRHRDRIGMGAVRWHDLRHIHASHLLAAGLPVSAVAGRMGHSSTRMTLDVYGHALPAHDRRAADLIGLASRPKREPGASETSS